MRTAVTSIVPNWGKSRAFNPLINTQVRGWSLKHPRNRVIPLVFKPSIFSLRIQGSWTNAITISYSDSCLHRTEAAARQCCKLFEPCKLNCLPAAVYAVDVLLLRFQVRSRHSHVADVGRIQRRQCLLTANPRRRCNWLQQD